MVARRRRRGPDGSGDGVLPLSGNETTLRFVAQGPDPGALTPLKVPGEGAAARLPCLVVSCEHGGNKVPPAHAAIFRGQRALLESHRGWDPGAIELGRQLAQAYGAPFFASTTTRLLIDLNRSIGNQQLFSELTRGLARELRLAIVASHYRPYRDAVEGEIARLVSAGVHVVHVASHSFTPVMKGVARRADVAWLYDPRRARERDLSRRWRTALAKRCPDLLLRRNVPYRGRSDGLAALLRTRFADADYAGIELEVNQRFVAHAGAPWDTLRRHLVHSLAEALQAEAVHDASR